MLATLIFPGFLQAFHSIYPDVHLQMVENGTLTNKTLVREGAIDAAIVSGDSPLPSYFASSYLTRQFKAYRLQPDIILYTTRWDRYPPPPVCRFVPAFPIWESRNCPVSPGLDVLVIIVK